MITIATSEYVREKHENAIKRYLNEVNIKDIFAYDYNYTDHTFTIYTARPGIWIGLHGAGVSRLEEILSEDISENCKVLFKEIKGNFVVHY